MASPDDGDDIDDEDDALRDVQRRVLVEVEVVEDVVPVDGVGHHHPAPGERGQVVTLAHRRRFVCRFVHLNTRDMLVS